MKTCLVTGGTGMIGSHLIRTLCNDYHTSVITRKPITHINPLSTIEGDLTQKETFNRLPDQTDCIIHLAQSEHYKEFPEKVEDVFNVNSISCLRLLDYARNAGTKTFILASSGLVYGNGDERFKEDDPLVLKSRDLGFYYTSKLCAEAFCETYAEMMNIIILRFFFVYGPEQRKSMLIPRLIQSVIDENPITLQGKDGIKINPTYVSDAVEAIRAAIHLKGFHRINVAGPEILSLRDVGVTIGHVLGKEPFFKEQNEKVPQNLVADIEKMSDLLTPPKVSFIEGIKHTIQPTYTETHSKCGILALRKPRD